MDNRLFLAAVALLSVVLLGAAYMMRPQQNFQVFSGPDAQPNVISVNGTGRLDVKPDTAIVTLGFQHQAQTAEEAQATANKAMADVLKAVKDQGIPDDKIKTSAFNLHAEYEYRERTAPVLVGYRVQSTITITIQQLDKTGPVIDASIKAGANQVQNVMFTLKDVEKHKQDAIDKALEDARAKAEKSAAKLGTTVVGVRRITIGEPWAGTHMKDIGIYGRGMEMASAPAMQIQPGELELQAHVQVEFTLGSK
jgi:uncharacterized protein